MNRYWVSSWDGLRNVVTSLNYGGGGWGKHLGVCSGRRGGWGSSLPPPRGQSSVIPTWRPPCWAVPSRHQRSAPRSLRNPCLSVCASSSLVSMAASLPAFTAGGCYFHRLLHPKSSLLWGLQVERDGCGRLFFCITGGILYQRGNDLFFCEL